MLDTKVCGKIAPHKRLTINVHLDDGMRKTHDEVTVRQGGVRQGRRDDPRSQADRLSRDDEHDGVQEQYRRDRGCASPSCASSASTGCCSRPDDHYETHAGDIFLTLQDDLLKKFQRVLELSKEYPVCSTPIAHLEFAAGMRVTTIARPGAR